MTLPTATAFHADATHGVIATVEYGAATYTFYPKYVLLDGGEAPGFAVLGSAISGVILKCRDFPEFDPNGPISWAPDTEPPVAPANEAPEDVPLWTLALYFTTDNERPPRIEDVSFDLCGVPEELLPDVNRFGEIVNKFYRKDKP